MPCLDIKEAYDLQDVHLRSFDFTSARLLMQNLVRRHSGILNANPPTTSVSPLLTGYVAICRARP